MRAIWNGTISFGLVSIPISLYPATRHDELKFRLLRKSDLSPVNYKRVAEVDGKEVPWDQIVKGYEHEKGKFVVIKDEDFERVDIEATQTVDIINFVDLEGINPLLFYKPYFVEAQKGGEKPYALLRDALASSGKIGIAKVVIKVRQHLAALKSQQNCLMLELMHFPHELLPVSEIKTPAGKTSSKPELAMAAQLINSMAADWNPEMYRDDYYEALEKLIEAKVAHGEKNLPPPKRGKAPTKAVDLVSILQASIKRTRGGGEGRMKTSLGKNGRVPRLRLNGNLHRN